MIIFLPYLNDYLSKLGIPPETDHKVKCMASRENIASVHCNVISSSQKSIHGQEQYFKNTKFVHIVHYLSLINCRLSRMWNESSSNTWSLQYFFLRSISDRHSDSDRVLRLSPNANHPSSWCTCTNVNGHMQDWWCRSVDSVGDRVLVNSVEWAEQSRWSNNKIRQTEIEL